MHFLQHVAPYFYKETTLIMSRNNIMEQVFSNLKHHLFNKYT